MFASPLMNLISCGHWASQYPVPYLAPALFPVNNDYVHRQDRFSILLNFFSFKKHQHDESKFHYLAKFDNFQSLVAT